MTYSPAKVLGIKRAIDASRTAVRWNIVETWRKSNKIELLLIVIFGLLIRNK
jgi:hypothetical protein